MQVIKSEFRRVLLSFLASSATAFLLASIGVQGALAGSLPVFSGITELETRLDAKGSAQIIEFKSDLPFQYQMQILDKNHVVFRLYNARLANNLITAEGGVNLLAGGAVESGRCRLPNMDPHSKDDYQEVVLAGPGLGTKPIQVLGATELPLVKPLAPLKPISLPKTSTRTLERFAAHPVPSGQPVKLVGRRPGRVLPNLAALQRSVPIPKFSPDKAAMALMALAASRDGAQSDSASSSPRIEINQQQVASAATSQMQPSHNASSDAIRSTAPLQEIQTQLAPGPQIEAVTISHTPPFASREESHEKVGYTPEESSMMTPSAPLGASSEAVSSTPDPQAQPPEPAYQVLMALPRYHGGAPPIQAMTLDADGNPIVVHPKSAPLREFNVDNRNGGYNALFQAETPELNSAQDTIDSLMNEALSQYRNQQYAEAEQDISKALQLDPSNADLHAALAEVQLKLNNPESAIQSYQQASQLSLAKYGPAYVQLLVQAGKRQDAIRVLEGMNKQHPRQEQIVYMLGTLHEELGQVGQALTYLKQAAQLHPASADIQYNLGLAYELSGDREQAERHYRSALTLSPKATDIAKALARVRN